jgi:hypothetical protein
MTTINKIDLVYELSQGDSELTQEVIQKAIRKVSKLTYLVTLNNLNELIPSWERSKNIGIEFEYQRRIPTIYLEMYVSLSGMLVNMESNSAYCDFYNLMKERIYSFITNYDEIECERYIENLFHPDVLNEFTKKGIKLTIKSLGEGSDT